MAVLAFPPLERTDFAGLFQLWPMLLMYKNIWLNCILFVVKDSSKFILVTAGMSTQNRVRLVWITKNDSDIVLNLQFTFIEFKKSHSPPTYLQEPNRNRGMLQPKTKVPWQRLQLTKYTPWCCLPSMKISTRERWKEMNHLPDFLSFKRFLLQVSI